MSFFKKLRDRMFRSSDKISEGLDALVTEAAPEAAKPSLLGRLIGRDETRRVVDDAMLESLEDVLIQADLGVDTALRVTANIAAVWRGKRVSTGELQGALADKFGLPIHAIGVGEQIDDLAPFDPQEFARALVGLDG